MEKRKKTSPIKEFTQRLPEPQEQEERFDINKCLFEIEFGRKRLIPLKDEIVRDYNCQTTLELMLAGRISTLYWRIARWEKWLNGERFPWDAPNYPHERKIITRTLRM